MLNMNKAQKKVSFHGKNFISLNILMLRHRLVLTICSETTTRWQENPCAIESLDPIMNTKQGYTCTKSGKIYLFAQRKLCKGITELQGKIYGDANKERKPREINLSESKKPKERQRQRPRERENQSDREREREREKKRQKTQIF